MGDIVFSCFFCCCKICYNEVIKFDEIVCFFNEEVMLCMELGFVFCRGIYIYVLEDYSINI